MSSTAQIATRPEPAHARADVVADLIGARRDQPAQHLADRDRERVGVPRRRAAAPASCRSNPTRARPRPRASRRARRRRARRSPPPAAHATTRPGSHDTCSCTVPARSSRAASSRRCVGRRASRLVVATSSRRRRAARLAGVTRPTRPRAAAARLEVGDDLLALLAPQRCARSRGAPRRRGAGAQRDAPRRRGSASSTASCSGVASPSTSASTYASNCHGASAVGVGRCHFGHASPSGIHGGHAGVPSKKHGLTARESGHHPRPDLGSFARRRDDLADSVPAWRDS